MNARSSVEVSCSSKIPSRNSIKCLLVKYLTYRVRMFLTLTVPHLSSFGISKNAKARKLNPFAIIVVLLTSRRQSWRLPTIPIWIRNINTYFQSALRVAQPRTPTEKFLRGRESERPHLLRCRSGLARVSRVCELWVDYSFSVSWLFLVCEKWTCVRFGQLFL